MIDLTINETKLERAVQRARQRNIIIPTFKQQIDPTLVSKRRHVRWTMSVYGSQSAQSIPHHLAQFARCPRRRIRRRQLPRFATRTHRC